MKAKNVLIVDDESTIRNIIKYKLKKYNVTIIEADNGYDVLFHLDKTKFDLIITDLSMPKTDGLTLVEEIRNNKLNSECEIIVYSGFLSDRVIKKLGEFNVTNTISKPESFDYFETIFDKYLEKKD